MAKGQSKTRIGVSEALLGAFKRIAAGRNIPLGAAVELALRHYREEQARTEPRLRRHTCGGRGLRAGLSERDWSAICARAYEGRGA